MSTKRITITLAGLPVGPHPVVDEMLEKMKQIMLSSNAPFELKEEMEPVKLQTMVEYYDSLPTEEAKRNLVDILSNALVALGVGRKGK